MPPHCKELGCVKQAKYNFKGCTPGIYCGRHQKPDMIDIYARRCFCGKLAVCGFSDKLAERCMKHVETGMVGKGLIFCRCGKQASFGKSGARPQFCKDCAPTEMKNIKSTRCLCGNTATFGLPGETTTHCGNCKNGDMTYSYRSTCSCGSGLLPHYGYNIKECCSFCRTKEMKELDVKKCKSEWCDVVGNAQRYDGYCRWCFIHLFPDRASTRSYKTKEKNVTAYLKKELGNVIDITFDKRIYTGCSSKRPDVFIDMGTHVIIVEIDENSHNSYDTTCENKRMVILSQDISHRPMTMIRFNPDSYKDDTGKRYSSCWKNIQMGISLDPDKIKEWDTRLAVLLRTIREWQTKIPQKMIEIVYLFFDGYKFIPQPKIIPIIKLKPQMTDQCNEAGKLV